MTTAAATLLALLCLLCPAPGGWLSPTRHAGLSSHFRFKQLPCPASRFPPGASTKLARAPTLRGRWPAGLLVAAASAAPGGVGSADEARSLEARVDLLRKQLAAQEGGRGRGRALPRDNRLALQLELALALQTLHHMRPDGGKRVEEAEQLYRWVCTKGGWKGWPILGGGARCGRLHN